MGIHMKNDYSFLFQNWQKNQNQNQASNLFHCINLSEYHSIKSGAYGKAVSAYFEKQAANGSDEKETGKDILKKDLLQEEETKQLAEIATEAEKLQKSGQLLTKKDANSVFSKEDGEVDREKVYQAVADFARNFNAFMDQAEKSNYKTIEQKVDDIKKTLDVYKDEMQSIGITVDDQTYKMGIAYDEYIAADMDAVRELFNGNTSMAYVVAVKTSFVGAEAKMELNHRKNYTSQGTYQDAMHQGNFLNHRI